MREGMREVFGKPTDDSVCFHSARWQARVGSAFAGGTKTFDRYTRTSWRLRCAPESKDSSTAQVPCALLLE